MGGGKVARLVALREFVHSGLVTLAETEREEVAGEDADFAGAVVFGAVRMHGRVTPSFARIRQSV